MREVLPGVFHWMAHHPKIGFEVSSYLVTESGTLLDPKVPIEGTDWFEDEREPSAIVLSNRHHDRDSAEFVERFGIGPVLVPESGLHEFEGRDLEIAGYAPGEEVVPGILVHEVGAICPDDMALEIRSVGALLMADALVHFEDGVRFVRDDYMDDPPGTRRGLAASLERLLDVDFDALLFAHGEPILSGGKRVLRDFLASRPGD